MHSTAWVVRAVGSFTYNRARSFARSKKLMPPIIAESLALLNGDLAEISTIRNSSNVFFFIESDALARKREKILSATRGLIYYLMSIDIISPLLAFCNLRSGSLSFSTRGMRIFLRFTR